MEVKSVYMDLVEWVKTRGVWKLESEAFKKPIEIKIWYDNTELQQFQQKYDSLLNVFHSIEQELNLWVKLQKEQDWKIEELRKLINIQDWWMQNQWKKISDLVDDVQWLMKYTWDIKTSVETLSGTILHLQEQTKENSQKLTKQPSVFHDKSFISGRENAGLWMIGLDNGDYLMILKTKIWEHNEYVTNKDELIIEKIHVDNELYVPFYKLEWGTELDLPTATIYYDLVFMPI